MRKILFSLLFLGMTFISNAQTVNIQSAISTNLNPTSCTTTSFNISLMVGCINYTFDSTHASVSNDTVYLDVYYTGGLICLGALSYPTHSASISNLYPQTYTVFVTSYLSGVVDDTMSAFPITVTTTGCCPAVGQIAPSSNPACFGDSLILQNNGSGATYQNWYLNGSLIDTASSTSFLPTSTGSYAVQLIVGNGTCADTSSLSVQVDSLPAVSLGNDTIICENSSVSFSPGSGYASYAWSNGATNQTQSISGLGQLSVTVTNASGCEASDTVAVIGEIPLIDIDLGSDTNKCIGDSVLVTASSNGTSFSWSNGFTGQSNYISQNGTYIVEASGAGYCPAKDTIIINSYWLEGVVISPDPNACSPRSVEVNQNYNSYVWTNGANTYQTTIEDSGYYEITVVDSNGCTQTVGAAIDVAETPDVNIGPDTTICEETSYFLNTNIFGAIYLWSTGSSSPTISVLQSGSYWLQVTDENGCMGADTMNLTVNYCVGISESDEERVQLFPNPAREAFYISSEITQTVQLFDVLGNLVSTFEVKKGLNNISLDSAPSGIYLLVFENHTTKKLIIE